MSRHAFYEIISNIDPLLNEDNLLVDRKGYSLHEWLDYGIVGWDAPLSSYFIHLDNNRDNIPWMIPNGIHTFDHLCDIISYIFDVPNGIFKFQDAIQID